MSQTRGRPTYALLHSGGAVRHIEQATVFQILADNDLPCDDQTAESIWQLLRARIIDIDAPPKTVRGNERKIQRIEKAAAELIAAMKDYQDVGDLNLSIDRDLSRLGYRIDEGRTLIRWLARFSVARERYFHPYQPSTSYHDTIARLRDVIRDAGGNAAVHETSKFFQFLLDLEAQWPCLIFPNGTVATGRLRYVERAIASHTPN